MDNEFINDIKRFLANDKAPVPSQWLNMAQEKYPYFTLPALLYLRNNGIDDNDELLDRLAIATADRNALALTLGADAKLFADFYPPEMPAVELDTEATIDKFLDSYGNSSQKEIDAISNAIFNPAPDYADILAAQNGEQDTQTPLTKEDELINSFIEQSKQKEFEAAPSPAHSHVEQDEVEEIADTPISEPSSYNDSMLSESLAKMYISRHKYDKALEIIENINLNFPEKSIYFADQIRFLRKLVTYQKFNKQ
ncbi:MAG: hypothetical protein II539_03500 [Muribaculaceae bacterium]|nr:hypothetical protein [Muribaculaceae bacterium]MBQ3961303.1 hypothetical protein [Muribaculaceae bacterium]